MQNYYLEIRHVHIGAVIVSGLLMLTRGLAHNIWQAAWVKARTVRTVTYTIDTLLLAAAVMLTMTIGQYPFVDHWLTMKVILLLVYIVLGYTALRRADARIRWVSLGGAALVYGFIVSIARAHDPLGMIA